MRKNNKLESILKNNTWRFMDRPENATIIRSRIVLRNKLRENGTLEHRKTRAVAKDRSTSWDRFRRNFRACNTYRIHTDSNNSRCRERYDCRAIKRLNYYLFKRKTEQENYHKFTQAYPEKIRNFSMG